MADQIWKILPRIRTQALPMLLGQAHDGPSESRRGFHRRNSTAMDGAIVDKIIANFEDRAEP
jgi:hypothetical protein